VHGLTGNRLGEIETVQLERFAEVRCVEQFLQRYDLRAARGGFAHAGHRPFKIGGTIITGGLLNETDGHGACGHVAWGTG